METVTGVYARLDAAPWFARCGLPLPADLPLKCDGVAGWSEATALCGGEFWDWVTMEARNRLTSYLCWSFRKEYQDWNPIVYHAKDVLEAGPWARVDAYVKEHKLEGFIAGRVRWDTVNAVMEAAYQDCNPPIFFLKLLEVYEAGHFPCGWEGTFPNGTLLVL